MLIDDSINGDTRTLTLNGKLDASTSGELDNALKSGEDRPHLIMDFAGVDYMSSAGLRVILSVFKAKSKKGTVKIINTQEAVMEIFESTGFADIMDISRGIS